MLVPFILFTNYSADPLFRHLNKRGILTCYWVVNNEDEIKDVIKRTGVNGIMTDKPKYLMEMIEN